MQQDPVTADSVFAVMEDRGYVTDRVSPGEWKSRLQETADRENDLELGVLVRSLESVEGYSVRHQRLRHQRVRQSRCGDRSDNSDGWCELRYQVPERVRVGPG